MIVWRHLKATSVKFCLSQRKGLSSMDIWKTCKAYKCQRCAGKRIQTYEKSSITDYMNKCSGDNDNYFWSKR